MVNKFRGNVILFVLFAIVVSFSVIASDMIDSDGDGVLDSHDKCLNTNPIEDLPIILRNPEFLGCSCSQIFDLMEGEYCKKIFCLPNRPLEIGNSAFSSRTNPCPSSRCEGTTLYYYHVDEIRCHQGRELPYDCEETIVEDAEFCITGVENESFSEEILFVEKDLFDVVVFSYLQKDTFVNILDMRNKEELIENNFDVLSNVEVQRIVTVNERVVNNKNLLVTDVSLIVRPSKYLVVDDFILVERISGNLQNKNLVINDEFLFDVDTQIIVWKVDSLKDEMIFSYRITPSHGLNFDFFVQGNSRTTVFSKLILPVIIILVLVFFVVFWIVNVKEKNRVFKN